MQRDPIHTRNEHREGAPEEREIKTRNFCVLSLWPDDEHLQFHILGRSGKLMVSLPSPLSLRPDAVCDSRPLPATN